MALPASASSCAPRQTGLHSLSAPERRRNNLKGSKCSVGQSTHGVVCNAQKLDITGAADVVLRSFGLFMTLTCGTLHGGIGYTSQIYCGCVDVLTGRMPALSDILTDLRVLALSSRLLFRYIEMRAI